MEEPRRPFLQWLRELPEGVKQVWLFWRFSSSVPRRELIKMAAMAICSGITATTLATQLSVHPS